jgi:hypothetical protein
MKLELKNNSITLPGEIIAEYHLQNTVEVDLRKEGLFIRAAKASRENWDGLFSKAYPKEDEQVENLNIVNENDETEWTW